MAKVNTSWWTAPNAISAFNANNAAALAAVMNAQNPQPAQANQWNAIGPVNPNAAPAMPALGPVNPNAAPIAPTPAPYQPVNGWLPPNNVDQNGVLQYTYTPPVDQTPPQWVQTAAEIGDVLAAPSRAVSNLIFPGNAAYRPDALKSDVRNLWQGKTPEWFAPADRYEGIVERELARDFRTAANAAQAGDVRTVLEKTTMQSAASMIPQTVEQFKQNPSLLSGVQVAMSAMGAMLPLMPKALFPVTNAPTQQAEAILGDIMSYVPVPGGAIGEGQKAVATLGGLEQTLQDVPGTMRRLQGEIDAVKRGEKPLLTIEEASRDYANTIAKAVADYHGQDFSLPYRQAGGVLDRPIKGNLNLYSGAAAVLSGDDPTTIDEIGRWVDYQSRHIVFSGPDARREAIDRIAHGENPQIAMRGLVAPPKDALDDEIELWEQSVQNHMAVTERVAYTSARMGGATDAEARTAAAEVAADAERFISEFGMIKGAERPLSEGILQTAFGFSPLDPMNYAGLGKLFGWQRLLPKARAQGQAATLSRVYEAAAKNAAGYTMAEEVAAAKRGLSPEMVSRETEAKRTLGLDTQGDQPTPRAEPTLADDLPAEAPGASANAWQRFGAQAYLQYVKIAELLPQSTGHMVQGYAMDMLHNLTRGARNAAEAARRIQAFVDEPGSLVSEMGSVPLSVKAEFARPVIRDAMDGIMKVLSGAGDRLDHGALLEGWLKPTEMAANKLSNVKPLGERSVLERWGAGVKGWLGEFALRTPGYAIRNAISDSVVMAMDGVYSLDTYKDLTKFLGKYKIDRALITGKRPEEMRESKLSRVPVIGTVQNAIGRMNEVWDDGRRVRAFTTAFRQFMGANYKPIISEGAKQILGPQFGDAVAKLEQMWRTGSSTQEIRQMYEAVISPRTAMDDFNIMGALESRGIPSDAVSPELGARVWGELRRATTDIEVNHILDKYEDMIIQDQQARMALMGDVVSPKGITEKTVEMDAEEYRAMLNKITEKAVKAGAMSQEDAVKAADEMARQVFEYEVTIHNARASIGQALAYLGDGADLQRAHALIAYAMDMEYSIRNTARENQHKLYLQTLDRINNTRGILRRDGIGIRRAWDEYRRLNDGEQRTRLREIAEIHKWTADAIIRSSTDWDGLLRERPDIAKAANTADRLLEQAMDLVRKGGVEDFEAVLLGNRTRIDLGRREAYRQAQVVSRAEPELAAHVFDVLLSTEKDVQMAAARTVGSVRLELARKDAGMIDLAEYDTRVNAHWNHYFDFAENRYGKYAQAQLLWMQVRNSAVAKGMRALGWEDDAIADLFGKTEQAEGMIRAQEILDKRIRGDVTPEPKPVRRERAPVEPEPARSLLEQADEAAPETPAAPRPRAEISYPYDVDALDGTKVVLADAVREILDNNIENAMDVAARFNLGEYEAGMLLRAAKATTGGERAPGKAGREARAVGSTPDKKYRLRRWLADLDDVIPSNTASGAVDPRYPAHFQPRDRTRQGMQQQVNKMALAFDSDAVLSDFRVVGRGAPTAVSMNGKWYVVDGNGRTLLLKKIKQDAPEKYAQYLDDLKSRLAENGFTEADLEGIRTPVLISELLDDVDVVEFAREGNVQQSMAMSPFEEARIDATRLLDDAVTKLAIGEDQTVDEAITSLDNQQLVIGFIRTLPETDRNKLVTKNATSLNQDGINRLKHALFVKTYNSESGIRLAESFIESADSGVKNIENAMFASLGQMARAETLANSGARDAGLAIADDLAIAVEGLARMRRSRQKLLDFINQIPIDGGQELTKVQKALVVFFHENAGAVKTMREFMRNYAAAVENQPGRDSPGMPGIDLSMTKQEIVYKLVADVQRAKEDAAKAKLFGEPLYPSPYDSAVNPREAADVSVPTEADSGRTFDSQHAYRVAGPGEDTGVDGRDATAGDGVLRADTISIEVETRPDTTPEMARVGRNLVADLELQDRSNQAGQAVRAGENGQTGVRRQGRVTTVASRLADSLRIDGTASLIGQRVQTAQDLGTLAQVFRDPRYETARYFFIDVDGKVIGETGVSSRLPGISVIAPEGVEDDIAWLKGLIKSHNAAQVWLMHNHPSGYVNPSQPDMQGTAQIAHALGEAFGGHIIIDHNKFLMMTRKMDVPIESGGRFLNFFNVEEVRVPTSEPTDAEVADFAARQTPEHLQEIEAIYDRDPVIAIRHIIRQDKQTDPLLNREPGDVNIGWKVPGMGSDFARNLFYIGKQYMTGDHPVLMGLGADYTLQAIGTQVIEDIRAQDGMRIAAQIRAFGRNNGARHVAMLIPKNLADLSQDDWRLIDFSITTKLLMDVVTVDGRSVRSNSEASPSAWMESQGVELGTIPKGRTLWDPGTQIDMFGNYVFDDAPKPAEQPRQAAQPARQETPRQAAPQQQAETPRQAEQPRMAAQAEQPRQAQPETPRAAQIPAEPKQVTAENITTQDAIEMLQDGRLTGHQLNEIGPLLKQEKLVQRAIGGGIDGERVYVTPTGKQVRYTDTRVYRFNNGKTAKITLTGFDREHMSISHDLYEIPDLTWDGADALNQQLRNSPVIPFEQDQRARIADVLNETKPMTRADVRGALEAVARGELDPEMVSAAVKQGIEDIERRAAPVRRTGVYKLPDGTELQYDGVGLLGGSGSYRVTLYMHDADGNQKTIYQFAPANLTAASAQRSALLRQITGSGTTITGGANARPTTTQPRGATAGDTARTGGARGTGTTARTGGADAAAGASDAGRTGRAVKPTKRGSDDSWLGGLFAHIPDEQPTATRGRTEPTTGGADAAGRTGDSGGRRSLATETPAPDTATRLDQGGDTQAVETGGSEAVQGAGEEGGAGSGSATGTRRTRPDVRGVHRGGSGVLPGIGDGTGNVEVGDTGGRTPAGQILDQEVRDTDAGIHARGGRGSGEDNAGVPQDTSLRLDDAPDSLKAETEAVRNDEARAIDEAWSALTDTERGQFTDWLTTSTHPIAGEKVPLATKYHILSRVFADEINDEPRSVRRGNGNYDYLITEKDAIGAGGARTKYKANIEAIRILKAIEEEGRYASPYEQAALVRYVGWGGLSQPVNTLKYYPDWHDAQREVRGMLTPAELESAGLSTPNAHFTSIPIVDAMWGIMQRLGFGGGRVLEPAGGIGHFLGRMPRDVYAKSTMTLVEMDSLTARIAKQLYQNADVHEKPYQEARIPNNWFDLSISNVPFGNYAVYDPAFRDNKALTSSIHNYYFAKSLEHVRPGGVIAFITSRYTMDSMGAEVRQYIADRAELIGAFRLPNTAFEGNANTNVTTDVLFLRKRAPSEEKTGPAWVKTVKQTDPVSGREYDINEYYASNPDMLLGRMEVTEHGNTSGNEWQPNLMPTRPLEEMLPEIVARFPENIYTEGIHVEAEEAQMVAAMAEFKLKKRVVEGQYMVMDSRLHKVVKGAPVPVQFDVHKTAALSDGARLVESLQTTLAEMMNPNSTDTSIGTHQQTLNTQYDTFVKRYGRVNDARVAEYFADDPLYPRLLSLEKKNEWGAWDKTDVFSKRVAGAGIAITQTDSAQEALYASLFKHNSVDLGYISQLLRRGRDETIEALGEMVYHDPDGMYVTKAEYLSGDVVGKLEEARVAAKTDERYQRNVEALEKVQPERIPAGKITARLGSPWIPPDVIESFITSLSGAKVAVEHIDGTTDWNISIKQAGKEDMMLQYQTPDVSFMYLVRQALALKQPTVTFKDAEGREHINQRATEAAREKQAKIKEAFEKWVWRDPARMGRLEDLYNRTFNSYIPRTWDGAHMQFPGMNPQITLNPHQKAGAFRIVSGQNVYLAHGVGTGKTFTMIAGGMELRRLGLRRKPMYVVPNMMLEQFEREFKLLYPMANIQVIRPDDLTPVKRPRMVAQIATSDLDGVIVSHETFARFPVSAEARAEFMRKQIADLDDMMKGRGDEKSWRFKQLQKQKLDLEARLEKMLSGKKDDATLFEELGVDQLFVDEAHAFKNLRYTTRLDGVKGMGSPEGNMKTMDMMLKVRLLNKMNGGGGVVYSSGTPVSNSLAETYTIMRYLQPDTLDQLGLRTFDAWAGSFAEVVESMEKTATGAKKSARLSGYVNMPELRFLMSETTDIKTQDTLKLSVPKIEGGEPQSVVAEKSPEMKAIIADLVKRAKYLEQNPGEAKKKGGDNILVINGDAKAAALDIRTYAKGLPDVPGSKLNTVVKNVLDIYQQTSNYHGTQMIFCDFSKPKKHGGGQRTGFSAYDDIIEKLVAGGIPRNEVVSIYDWDTPQKKAQLNKLVNEGKVRVVLGSTDKLGTGTNMQQRLYAAHHLDIPYTPAKMEQRNGRVVRQGNLHVQWDKPVKVLNYVTKGTFDEVMWALLRKKGSFVATFMSEKPLGRKGVDDSALVLNARQMEMASSDDPTMLRQAELENDIQRYENLHAEYLYQRQQNGVRISQGETKLERQRQDAQVLSRAAATYRTEKQKPFSMRWNNETHSAWIDKNARTTVNNAMIAWAKDPGEAPPAGEVKPLGEVQGLRLEWDGRYDSPDAKFRGVEHLFHASPEGRKMIEAQMEVGPVIRVVSDYYGGETVGKFILSPRDGAQNITRLENILTGLEARKEAAINSMRDTENLLRELRMQMAQPFEHDMVWDRSKVELADLKSKFSVQDEVIDEVDAIERNEDYTGREAKVFQEEGAPDPYAALNDEQIEAAALADAPVPVDGLVAQDADAEMTGNTGETHAHQSLLDYVTKQQLEALNAIRDGALKHLGDAPKRTKPTLSADQLKVLEAEVQQAVRQLNETVDAGKTYANERSNFALMDYGNKRGFDLWLSSIAPFYYWATRQGRNFILRALDNPQFLIAYWRYKEAMKKHNKRRGTRKRFETAFRIPTRDLTGGAMDDVYWDPTSALFPFDQMYGEGYDEEATGLQGMYNTASQFGMRPHPVIDVPLRLTGALTSKSPNQEGYEAEQAEWGPGSVGKLLQQSSLVQAVSAALGMGPSGMGINPESPLRKALGLTETEGFDAYRVGRSISNMAAEQNKAYGEQFDRRPYLAAQEFVAKHVSDLPTALTSMKPAEIAAELGIDPTMAAYALQVAQAAARMAAQERGTSQVASILGGQRLVAHPQGEYERAEMSRQERGAAWNPATQQGSRVDVQAVQRANPALEVQRAQYGTLPGEQSDYRWLYDRAMQDEINTKFDALKEQVIVMRPWDRKAGYAIEDARRAALDRVDRDKVSSTAAWQDDYLRAMNATAGTNAVPQSVSPATALQSYKPRSVAGANPTEKLEIRQQEIMQQVSRTQPRAESFMTPQGEIDYKAYRMALDEWRGSLGKVAAGLPATQLIMAKATEEGNAATMKQFMAGLTGDQLDQYRWRYDTPLEAAQRTYYEAIYTPVMEAYVTMRDQGDTEAWDKTIGAVGAIAGPMLADLTNRLYQGRFTPEQLAEVQRINIPAMAEVMRLNQGPEAKAKTAARDDFWNTYNNGIPPGSAAYEIKQNPLVALILDRDSRGTATTEQYEIASASMRQYVVQNYGGVQPEWTQARQEKTDLDKALSAQYGADAPALVQAYDFAGNAEQQAALRAQYPILNTILLMRYQYEQAHPVYALYYSRKVAKSEQAGVGIAAPAGAAPSGGGTTDTRTSELGVLKVRKVGR